MARTLLASTIALLLCACPEKKAAPSAAAAPPTAAPTPTPAPVKKAEVEFSGSWARNGVTAAKVIFVAQAEPCLPLPAKPTRFGEEVMKSEGPLFAEFFIPQGSTGHACLYGLNEAGVPVAAASYEKNPVTFQGEGEVVVGPVKLSLVSLPSP